MKEHNKRWILSMLKTSGSKRHTITNRRYADTRQLKHQLNFEDLPTHESIKSSQKFCNSKINYGLLVRFLRNNVGGDWDQVYSEIIGRIPTKLLDYKEVVFWFVADKVEMINGRPWNKKSQRFIWTGETIESAHYSVVRFFPEQKEFYVHPETNKLVRIEQIAFKRLIRK